MRRESKTIGKQRRICIRHSVVVNSVIFVGTIFRINILSAAIKKTFGRTPMRCGRGCNPAPVLANRGILFQEKIIEFLFHLNQAPAAEKPGWSQVATQVTCPLLDTFLAEKRNEIGTNCYFGEQGSQRTQTNQLPLAILNGPQHSQKYAETDLLCKTSDLLCKFISRSLMGPSAAENLWNPTRFAKHPTCFANFYLESLSSLFLTKCSTEKIQMTRGPPRRAGAIVICIFSVSVGGPILCSSYV